MINSCFYKKLHFSVAVFYFILFIKCARKHRARKHRARSASTRAARSASEPVEREARVSSAQREDTSGATRKRARGGGGLGGGTPPNLKERVLAWRSVFSLLKGVESSPDINAK